MLNDAAITVYHHHPRRCRRHCHHTYLLVVQPF